MLFTAVHKCKDIEILKLVGNDEIIHKITFYLEIWPDYTCRNFKKSWKEQHKYGTCDEMDM